MRSFCLAALLALPLAPREARAFCGFYVGKADTKLFNKASQVILARDGDRMVISMSNDYRGDLKEFALVVPVPVVLKKEQVHIGKREVFERLDAYSAPRLVEYHDPNPCMRVAAMRAASAGSAMAKMSADGGARDKALGVTVEAAYTVGEYDIVILGAKQSDGLETWLGENGYKMPKGASRALQPYIKQKLKFFVAKVNLGEQAKTGTSTLRPLQFAFESPRYMLPIRLGMINADGPQDLVIYALGRTGRVETTNYRTVKLPSDMDLPEFVKDEFPKFYKDMFAKAVEGEGKRAVFTEYFWNMGWCDPCSADPLSPEELRQAGVFWLSDDGSALQPGIRPRRGGRWAGGGVPVFITRLHVRYDPEHFPEDLVFQETADNQNFQGRYVMRHAWKDDGSCPEAGDYRRQLAKRREQEAKTLATLTGWDPAEIRQKMRLGEKAAEEQWYKDIFR
ncbi:MAG: DUF2330 domain-containing protein [Elusimicrobia bacterium]|nr:DUF2330 domain-containing protein [Elusimicrobiota bacterium]